MEPTGLLYEIVNAFVVVKIYYRPGTTLNNVQCYIPTFNYAG